MNHHKSMENFLTRITARLINAATEELDGVIYETLKECGIQKNADRTYICQFKPQSRTWVCSHEWRAEHSHGYIDVENNHHKWHEKSKWLLSRLIEGEIINISLTDSNSSSAVVGSEEALIKEMGMEAILWIPMSSRNTVTGFFGIEMFSKRSGITENERNAFTILANMFSVLLQRVELEHLRNYQLGFRQLMSDISTSFVNIPEGTLDSVITHSLKNIGQFFEADRSFLFTYSTRDEAYSLTHEWVCTGIKPSKHELQNLSLKDFEWLSNHLYEGNAIYIQHVDELASEANSEKEILVQHDVKSLLALPIFIHGKPYGLLGFVTVNRYAELHSEQISSFQLLSAIFSDMIMKNTAETNLRSVSAIQEIMLNLAAAFINLNLKDIDQAIYKSLKEIGTFVDADRAYIFEYEKASQMIVNTYEWCNEGISPHIDDFQSVPISVIEDWFHEHVQGRPVVVHDVMLLPEESEQKRILQNQQIKSVVTVPMLLYRDYIGFVGFDSVKKKHLYTDKEISILNIFAQMLVNIDQRKKLQKHLEDSIEEAERANKAKSVFLANMSHEIRTPLNGVIGFMDMLKHTHLSAEQDNYIDSALKSAESLMEIINDILDLSKVEAGKLELEEVVSNLHEIAKQAIDILRYSAKKKKLNVFLEIGENVPEYVVFDPLRLKQILVNLIGNAVKFTEQGSVCLRVHFSQPEAKDKNTGFFKFQIEDTGIGISEDKKSRLFKAFSQIDSAITKRYGGTGLGLIISNMLANKMGSSIELDSEPGVGSRFYFTLEKEFIASPTQELLKKEVKVDKKVEPVNSLTAKILVAEDTELNRLLVKSMIKKLFPNSEIIEAVNGSEAVSKYQEYEPDIVFMDIQMPVMSGFDASREIREIENDSGSRTPIIALTASVTSGAEARCLESGMDAYIAKPFRDYQIKGVIQQFLNPEGS